MDAGGDEPHDEARFVESEDDAPAGPLNEEGDAGHEHGDGGRDDDRSKKPQRQQRRAFFR